jgi:hypothetical protein
LRFTVASGALKYGRYAIGIPKNSRLASVKYTMCSSWFTTIFAAFTFHSTGFSGCSAQGSHAV